MAKLVCVPSWEGGLSPACEVGEGPSTAVSPLTVVYLVECPVGWHSSILPRRKGIQRAVALSLYTQKRGTRSLGSPSLLVWPD